METFFSAFKCTSIRMYSIQCIDFPAALFISFPRRYPVMWQGHLTLKNESAAVQLHFLSGNVQLAKGSLPGTGAGRSPALRIAQRMRLEQTQLEGVQRRMQV